ncbi:phosphate transport system ATP-binding protein [Tangfeifania diversioriginum]|uniref:Phosphate transport system ATP-binding protein n=1 Tax=Tangfeifania diversioriginum TaxID=1168035 RepID=A0A1M6H4T5_9BACT|nr:phosphate ABC transporter ATP-binding protein [Tangfeifania diversioriginum]SHJ17204.1 phosphate transport system ATP-binding protein [Tangfeifania diversioriginum]
MKQMAFTYQPNLLSESVTMENQTEVAEMKKDSPIIEIKNLNVKTSEGKILKDINLKIPKNKIVVLLGPSGCGKTTLLKSLNRLTDLYKELKVSGQIIIDGQDIMKAGQNLAVMRQKMGLLSQRPFPLPASIYKNVAYGLKLKGIRSKKLISHSVETNLKRVGLWNEVKDRLKSPVTSLSIGQQQRLCLARGLAVKPAIILADEPTSALDPISTKIIENLFKELKQHYTIILVTHVLRQALRLADHVVFMYYGEIIEQGHPDEILKNPKTAILKKYLVDGN